MFFSFRVQKGTLVAISREVIRTYAILKEKYPKSSESELASLIWERWLPINRERLWTDDSETRFARFEEICDKRQIAKDNENVFTVFFDILYIETGISPFEKDKFKKSASRLCKDAGLLGFNFNDCYKKELENAKQMRKESKKEQKNLNIKSKGPKKHKH